MPLLITQDQRKEKDISEKNALNLTVPCRSNSMADFGDRSPSYRCRSCQTPIAFRSDLLSKSYVAKSGAAFMFSHAVNIIAGEKQDRELLTGMYTVAGIYCSNCGQELGWKYLKVYQDRQKFKEGKFIIERAKLLKEY